MFGIGGSYSSAKSQSSSFGVSQSQSAQGSQQTSGQSIAYDELFRSLFGDASGATANAAAMAPALTGQAAQLFSGGVDFLGQLQGNPGSDYLASRVNGPDDAEAAQLDALKSGLGDLFRDELNPAITDAGVASGTLGGGRQGVAQGVAAGKIAQQYQTGAAQIMANSQAARDAAATNLNNSSIAAAGTGLGSLGSLFSLLQSGANAGIAPYLMLAQIMGGPTTLTQSQGTSFGDSSSSSYDSSQSSSSSHSTSLNFGM
jgi:hypothetical protein